MSNDWPPLGALELGSGIVLGTPRTAGSKRSIVVTRKDETGKRVPVYRDGRPVTVVKDDSGEEGEAWRNDVRAAVRSVLELQGLIEAPMALELVLVRPSPKSRYGSGRNAALLKDGAAAFPTTKPDATKQLRAFEDALTKVVWRDDSQVVDLRVSKRYGEPACALWALYSLPATVGEWRLAHGGEEALDGSPPASALEQAAGKSVTIGGNRSPEGRGADATDETTGRVPDGGSGPGTSHGPGLF